MPSPNAHVRTDFDQLVAALRALPVKLRLQALEALKEDAVVQFEEELRFRVESLAEYKRARKQMAADADLKRWVAGFTAGDIFYDIGANTGTISLGAARRHHGRVPVYAFEPAADSFAALVRNIRENDLATVVTPLQVALFDRTGIESFHRASVGAGTALHAVGEAIDYARRPFEAAAIERVAAFRLDDLVRVLELPLPTRLKLDVDGVEHKVLAGATRVLAESGCDVYVELVEREAGDPHTEGVATFFRGLGYVQHMTVEHRASGVYPRVFDALFVRRDVSQAR